MRAAILMAAQALVPVLLLAQPYATSISPTGGSSSAGQSVTFTASYHDPNGDPGDIQDAQVWIGPSGGGPACNVGYAYINLSQIGIYLVDNDGHSLLGPILQGNSGTLSNSKCTITVNGFNPNWSSGTGVTANLTYTFQAAFNASLSGPLVIQGYATGADGNYSDWIQFGSGWRVGPTTVTVTGTPGCLVSADGQGPAASLQFSWIAGNQYTLVASLASPPPGTQYLFQGWSDGNVQTADGITVPTTDPTFTANCQTQYSLTTAVNPADSGTISPGSGWYNAGAQVAISASCGTLYQFSGFSGPVSNGMVTMTGPMTVTANCASSPPTGPALSMTKTHANDMSPGTEGAYTIIVSNVGVASTTDTVIVTDTLPSNMSAVLLNGYGWNCTLSNLTCTRTDSLGPGNSYPAITLLVNVSMNAPVGSPLTNTAMVSGGGDGHNHSVLDPTNISSNPNKTPPVPRVDSVALSGSNSPGQSVTLTAAFFDTAGAADIQNAQVYISAGYPGGLPACNIGYSYLPDNLQPFGVTLENDTETGTLSAAQNPGESVSNSSCTVTIPTSGVWPPVLTGTELNLTLTVVFHALIGGNNSVFAFAQSTQSGSASDWTQFGYWYVTPSYDLSLTMTDNGPLAPGQSGSYTMIVSNPSNVNMGWCRCQPHQGCSGQSCTQETVQVTVTPPPGLAINSIGGNGWSCTQPAGPCQIVEDGTTLYSLPAGGSNPPITMSVTAPSSNYSQSATMAVSASVDWVGGYGAQDLDQTNNAAAVTKYLLSTSANPPAGGTITPPTTWYDSGTNVQVAATPGTGVQFTGFGGDLTGATNPQSLAMTQARSVVANFVAPPAAAPSFSLAGGTYTGSQNLTLSTASLGASIWYTTDQSTPSPLNGIPYLGAPILISAPPNGGATVIKAIASGGGWSDSPANSGTYTIRDFTLRADCQPTPASCAIPLGGTATYTVTATPLNGFNGSVTLAPLTASPQPASWNPNLERLTLLPGAWTAQLTVKINQGSLQLPYIVHIVGTTPGSSSPLIRSWDALLSVSSTQQYYVTTSVAPAGAGTISPASGYYNSGQQLQFIASGGTNQFVNFSINGIATSGANPTLYNVTGPLTVVANFSGGSGPYTISGKVTQLNGPALDGTTVTVTGTHSQTVNADAGGNYSLTLPAGTYTVTPSSPFGPITPAGRTYTITNANIQNENYRIVPLISCLDVDCSDQPPVVDGGIVAPNVNVPANGQSTPPYGFRFLESSVNAQGIPSNACTVDGPPDVTATATGPSQRSPNFQLVFNARTTAQLGLRNMSCAYQGRTFVSLNQINVVAGCSPQITSITLTARV